MRTFGGIVIDGKLPPEIRVPLQELDVFCKSLSATLTTSQGTQVGGTSMVPTIRENDAIIAIDKAVPMGAVEEIPGIAHWIRCNSSGQLEVSVENEVSIAELPAVASSSAGQVSGSHLDWPAEFSYIAGLTTVRRASTMGSTPNALGIVSGAPWRDLTYGYQTGVNTDEELAIHVMETPKGLLQQHVVFEGKYYVGGVGGFPTVTFGTGGVGDDVYASGRFRRMAMSFVSSITGTPPGTMDIRVFGINEISGGSPVAAHSSLIKRWVFDTTSWLENLGTKTLEWEVQHTYFVITIVGTAGSDVSNNYEISNFFIVGKT